MAFIATLCYASLLDIQERRVPFRTWYPMLLISIPFSALFYSLLIARGEYAIAFYLGAMAIIFSLFFYLFAYFNLFGGADAWALIFISVCIPTFPFTPLLDLPPHAFFPFSVLINAVLINLLTPVAIYLYNFKKGNTAPFPYLFIAYPVIGSKILESHGFVMEEFQEDDGVLKRRFIGIGEAIRRMATGKGRIYTVDLRRNPDKFRNECALFEKAGRVWITYGIPFIVPICAGMIIALFFGDIFNSLLNSLNGV